MHNKSSDESCKFPFDKFILDISFNCLFFKYLPVPLCISFGSLGQKALASALNGIIRINWQVCKMYAQCFSTCSSPIDVESFMSEMCHLSVSLLEFIVDIVPGNDF
jgi:hypothetical protein